MTEQHPTEETRERAALYALGTLEGEEARSFEQHLQTGCRDCQAEVQGFQRLVGWLGFSAEAVRPSADLRADWSA